MKLESEGILISLRPFDEHNAVASVFTLDYGIISGMMRGALSGAKNKPLVGQVGMVSWNARLDSALGVFHWESERNLAAPIMMNPKTLGFMNAVFDLSLNLLPEREAYLNLYNETLNALRKFALDPDSAPDVYLSWEVCFLRELGYALNLTRCSGCGKTENLNYLSPRTGRAVCDDCAAPYVNRLYKLPLSLLTTFRFIENICVQQDAKIPQSRIVLNSKK